MTKNKVPCKKCDQLFQSVRARQLHAQLTGHDHRPRGRPKGDKPPLTAKERKERFKKKQKEKKAAAASAAAAANSVIESEDSLPTNLRKMLTAQENLARKTRKQVSAGAPGRYAHRVATVAVYRQLGDDAFVFKIRPFDKDDYDMQLAQKYSALAAERAQEQAETA